MHVQLFQLLFYPWINIVSSSDKFPFIPKTDTDINIETDLKVPGCGEIRPEASSRIVNGNQTPKWYPWATFISRYVAKPFESDDPVNVDGGEQFIVYPFYCTASIISKRSILTAAHCLCSHKSDVENNSRPPPFPWLKVVCLKKHLNQHRAFYRNPTPKHESVEKLHEKNIMIDSKTCSDNGHTKCNFPNFNEITARIGSKDFHDAKRIEITEAYVFGDNFKSEDPDVGLIITKLKINMQGAYPQEYVLPICLPIIKARLKWKKVTMVGWGTMFDHDMMKLPPSEAGPVHNASNSSCMSNQAGDLDYRFQFCDLDEIVKNNYECNKKFPPNQPDENKQRCPIFWEQAREYTDRFGEATQLEFEEADQIHILTSSPSSNKQLNEIVCYKEDYYLNNGWCTTKIGRYKQEYRKKGWGICSESCKLIRNDNPEDKSQLLASTYHEATFYLVNQGEGYPSRRGEGYLCRKSPNWAHVCLVGIKPITNVWTFNLEDVETIVANKWDDGKPMPSPIVERLPQYTRGENVWKNYQSVCGGNSGAAIWSMEKKVWQKRDTVLVKEGIAIQIAVISGASIPCGHQDFADKISDPRILKWIATHWKK